MPSYQYRKSHCGDKTISRPSYLHNVFPILVRVYLYIESGPWCCFTAECQPLCSAVWPGMGWVMECSQVTCWVLCLHGGPGMPGSVIQVPGIIVIRLMWLLLSLFCMLWHEIVLICEIEISCFPKVNPIIINSNILFVVHGERNINNNLMHKWLMLNILFWYIDITKLQ